MIKIVVADDHKIVIDGIISFLEKESNIEIVGHALDGEEVIEILDNVAVDLAILDIEMPNLNGIETTKQIKERFPATKVLILSMYRNKDYILNLFRLGVNGYVLKNKGKEDLVSAINAIHQGRPYYPLDVMQIIQENPFIRKESPKLSDREIEVLCLVARAKTSKEIGKLLFISKVTVESHIRNIKDKLGFTRSGELIRYALKNNICD